MNTEQKRIRLFNHLNNPPAGEHAYEAFEQAINELANMSDEEVEQFYDDTFNL